MKRLLIYDLDGTLADTKADIARAANHMLERLDAPRLSQQEICRSVGLGLKSLIERCLKSDDPARIEEGMRIYRAFYAEHLLDETRLYPGVGEVLQYFKERKQIVLTNKPNPYSQQILEGLGVADYFLKIIAGDSAYPKKPNPGAILGAMREEGISPPDTLLIGDSPIDVEAGRNAGIQTVVVQHGFADGDELELARPDWIVQDLWQFLKLAQKERW